MGVNKLGLTEQTKIPGDQIKKVVKETAKTQRPVTSDEKVTLSNGKAGKIRTP
jgi:hypothetical protein